MQTALQTPKKGKRIVLSYTFINKLMNDKITPVLLHQLRKEIPNLTSVDSGKFGTPERAKALAESDLIFWTSPKRFMMDAEKSLKEMPDNTILIIYAREKHFEQIDLFKDQVRLVNEEFGKHIQTFVILYKKIAGNNVFDPEFELHNDTERTRLMDAL